MLFVLLIAVLAVAGCALAAYLLRAETARCILAVGLSLFALSWAVYVYILLINNFPVHP